MTIIDHLFFIGLAVVYPVSSHFSFQRLLRRVAAGEVVGPSGLYRSTLIGHWALFGLALAIWAGSGRAWPELGFGAPAGTGFLVALALSVAAIAALVVYLRPLASPDEKTLESLRGQLGKLEFLVPRNGKELNRFYAVATTAGIVEETLWRGYMIWYLGQAMPLWVAATASSIAFGLAHAYQGRDNVPRVTVIGGLFAVLYLVSGSLWLPMLVHAVVDALQARAVCNALPRAPREPAN